MNQNNKLVALIILLFISAFDTQVFGQQTYEAGPDPEMKVSGTSTIHDWDMVSNVAEGTAILRLSAGKVTAIQSAKMTMSVKTLKSGKGQMDNNAYKALKEADHPNITFQVLEAHQDGGSEWIATGRLQLAGVTKTIPFQLQFAQSGEGLSLSGVADIKLTDFKVDPPTAIFGTIKTGDEMTINLKMKLNPIN
jgi:hypothetical protein